MAEVIHRYVSDKKNTNVANEKLINERIRSVATKRLQGELTLAKDREEVIYKDLVKKQAQYLMVNLRQKILNIPSTYARKLTGIDDIIKVQDTLREMSLHMLNELKDLPNTVTDPDWLLKQEKREANGE
jgi:hypothetical protein